MSDRTCSIEGCDRPLRGHGYCKPHYQRWYMTGDARPWEPIARRSPDKAPHRPRTAKYTLTESYFDEIATQEQAYWLGFIAADGSIVLSGTKSYSLRIELSERDAKHLEAMAASLGTDKPVRHSVRRNGGSLGGAGEFAYLAIDSWRITEALQRLGVTPRKSATAEPWDGPADLMPHYWRGLFDGDGSLGPIATRGHWNLQFCGSEACVRGFAHWARVVCGASAAPRLSTRSALCWYWGVSGSDKPQALAKALYGDACVALARKQALAMQLCSIDFAAIRSASYPRPRKR